MRQLLRRAGQRRDRLSAPARSPRSGDRDRSGRPGAPRFEVFGAHNADPRELLDTLRQRLEREIATLYLEPSPLTGHWSAAGTQVAGRLTEDERGEPTVIVDGRRLSWEHFGQALRPLDGWESRISFGPDEGA